MTNPQTFGERLRAARRAMKLTQKALAGRVGMSQSNLSELEGGEYPSSSFTPALAEALGVRAIWLAEGRGPKYPDAEATRLIGARRESADMTRLSGSHSDLLPLHDLPVFTEEDFMLRTTELPPEGILVSSSTIFGTQDEDTAKPGDRLHFDTNAIPESGDLVLVETPDQGVSIGRYTQGHGGTEHVLIDGRVANIEPGSYAVRATILCVLPPIKVRRRKEQQ